MVSDRTSRYLLRQSSNTIDTAAVVSERARRFKAATHLASAISSGDQFTKCAIEIIKDSISQKESKKCEDLLREECILP